MTHANQQAYGACTFCFGPVQLEAQTHHVYCATPVAWSLAGVTPTVLDPTQDSQRLLDVLASGASVLWAAPTEPTDADRLVMRLITQAGFALMPVTATQPTPDLPALQNARRIHHFRLPGVPGKQERSALATLRYDRHPSYLELPEAAVPATLAVLAETLGDRRALLWTATNGQLYRDRLHQLADILLPRGTGKALLLVEGLLTEDTQQIRALLADYAAEALSRSDMAKRLAARLDIAKSEAYSLVMELAPATDTSEAGPNVIRITARGHVGLKATHHKTLELKRAEELGPKETCVLAVGADWSPEALKRHRGKVRVDLAVAGMTDRFEAELCPQFNARDRIVFRKSGKQSQVTLGVHAEKGAGDIDRKMVAALTDPNTELILTMTPLSDEGA